MAAQKCAEEAMALTEEMGLASLSAAGDHLVMAPL